MAGQRVCIKCKSPQEPIVVMGVEIDRCPNCGGIWLDGGELRELAALRPAAGDSARLEAAIEQLARVQSTRGGELPVAADASAVPCPACGGKLTMAHFAQAQIEYCNACQGVFLDRGELARTMERLDSNQATTIMALAASVTASGFIGG